MKKLISIILFFAIASSVQIQAQDIEIDTLGITNGSVHMKIESKYTDFLKKYKGSNQNVTIHIWYNPTGSSLSKKEIKAGKDEIYFLYGRNLKTSSIEMDFKFGANARQAFSKKKYKELIKLVELFDYDVFNNENFSSSMCWTALENSLK